MNETDTMGKLISQLKTQFKLHVLTSFFFKLRLFSRSSTDMTFMYTLPSSFTSAYYIIIPIFSHYSI